MSKNVIFYKNSSIMGKTHPNSVERDFLALPNCWGRVGMGCFPNIIWHKKLLRHPLFVLKLNDAYIRN